MALKLKRLRPWLCLWLVIPGLALAGCAGMAQHKPEPDIERIAIFQMAPIPGDFAANHHLIEEAIRLAAAEGANIFVTPELAEAGYEFADTIKLPELPEYPSPWLSQLAGRAKETQMTLFIGFPQRSGEHYYNAVAAISRQGHIAGVHQKINIIPSPEESWATPGDTRPITVDGLKIGYFICADAANAELIQADKDDAPDLLLSSAAWYPDPEMGPEPFWQQVTAEIEAPFFIANTTGHIGKIDFSHSSSAVYQGGRPLFTLSQPGNSLYFFDWNRQSGQIELVKTLPVEPR
jgi:predicted amidohydrolase